MFVSFVRQSGKKIIEPDRPQMTIGKVKVKQSRYRPGVAQKVPGS
jgi:hypothetical protein